MARSDGNECTPERGAAGGQLADDGVVEPARADGTQEGERMGLERDGLPRLAVDLAAMVEREVAERRAAPRERA